MTNNIQLLVGGKNAFGSILENIKKAHKSIEINMFIWRDDHIGNLMAQELIEAANRGVKISISKDKLGCIFELSEESRQSFFNKKFDVYLFYQAKMLNLLYPMERKAKSQKQQSNKLVKQLLDHPNIKTSYSVKKRDHSKYYIFDDQILIMGGINIEDKEINTDVEGKVYHDYMVEFRGSTYVNKFRDRLSGKTVFDKKSKVDFIFNTKHDKKKLFEIKETIINLLDTACESVYIVMAYIGDRDIEHKIEELVNNGIKVVLITSAKSNLQQDLNMKILQQLINKTNGMIEVYLSPRMIHAKLIKIDEKLVTIGSTNLNHQSMSNLAELNAVISLENSVFSDDLEKSIINQINLSKRVNDSSELKYNKLRAILEGLA